MFIIAFVAIVNRQDQYRAFVGKKASCGFAAIRFDLRATVVKAIKYHAEYILLVRKTFVNKIHGFLITLFTKLSCYADYRKQWLIYILHCVKLLFY